MLSGEIGPGIEGGDDLLAEDEVNADTNPGDYAAPGKCQSGKLGVDGASVGMKFNVLQSSYRAAMQTDSLPL